MAMPSTNFRFYYLDDSGSAASGYSTFTWLSFTSETSPEIRQRWTDFRTHVADHHGYPADKPLHATDLAGRHRRPTNRRWHNHPARGAAVVRDGLDIIAGQPWTSAGTAYRYGTRRAETKYGLYRAVLNQIETELHNAGHLGQIIMDGGIDRNLIRIHIDHQRAHGRHLVEHPSFQLSTDHHGVQMADLAAWAGYHAIAHRKGKAHTWSWYADTIGRHDPHGPIPL